MRIVAALLVLRHMPQPLDAAMDIELQGQASQFVGIERRVSDADEVHTDGLPSSGQGLQHQGLALQGDQSAGTQQVILRSCTIKLLSVLGWVVEWARVNATIFLEPL